MNRIAARKPSAISRSSLRASSRSSSGAFLRTNHRNATPSAAASTRRSARRRRRRRALLERVPAPRQQRRHLLLQIGSPPADALGLGHGAFLVSPARATRVEPGGDAVQAHHRRQPARQRRLLRLLRLRLGAARGVDVRGGVAALGFETHSLADAEQDLVRLVQALEGSLRRGPLLGRVLVRVRAQRAAGTPRSPRAPTPSRPAEDPPARRPGGPPRRPSPTRPRGTPRPPPRPGSRGNPSGASRNVRDHERPGLWFRRPPRCCREASHRV